MSPGNLGCSLVAQSDTLRPASQSESSIYGMYGHAAPATLGWIRMSPNRLPRHLLYSELQEGRRSRGGQMKRFPTTSSYCWRMPDQLKALAADRLVWSDVCRDGLATFSINYDQEAEARRRHTISSPPTAGPRCHICDKICASDFGLRSHLLIHNRPSSTS